MIAPLNLNLNGADISMPTLMPSDYIMEIISVKDVESKSKPGNYFLEVQLATTNDAVSDKGKEIRAGYKITDRLMLPIPGTDFGSGEMAESYRGRLGKFQAAVLGLKITGDKIPDDMLPNLDDQFLADCMGKFVKAKVATEKDDVYGTRNVIKGISANV